MLFDPVFVSSFLVCCLPVLHLTGQWTSLFHLSRNCTVKQQVQLAWTNSTSAVLLIGNWNMKFTFVPICISFFLIFLTNQTAHTDDWEIHNCQTKWMLVVTNSSPLILGQSFLLWDALDVDTQQSLKKKIQPCINTTAGKWNRAPDDKGPTTVVSAYTTAADWDILSSDQGPHRRTSGFSHSPAAELKVTSPQSQLVP